MELVLPLAIVVIILVIIFMAVRNHLKQKDAKFKALAEAHNKLIEVNNFNSASLSVQKEHRKEEREEFEILVESQKNVILSQRKELASLNVGVERLKEKNETVIGQKKSSEVKLGLMAENFMPFLDGYPYDHKNFRFLANPCDGIQFNTDDVIFIEFKTGNAKLSSSQRRIKDLVGQGKVRFETFRVDEKGMHLKIESTMEAIGE